MARDPLVYSLTIPSYGRFVYRIGDRGLISLDWQDEEGQKEDYKDPLGLSGMFISYFSGERIDFRDLPVDYNCIGPIYREILEFIRTIPYGSTLTYGEVAKKLGRPKSSRIVGSAMRVNPCPIVLPCHRVIGKHSLGGYSLGIEKKILLLKLEGVNIC
ncbi:MAG: methylated-DNA--[protein]-cysteine S-methyltransferase [bacterium]